MSKERRNGIVQHTYAMSVAALAAAICMDAAASPVASPKSAVIVVFQQAVPFHQFQVNARSDERFAAAPQDAVYLAPTIPLERFRTTQLVNPAN